MKHPIILEGKPFDWDAGAEAAANIIDEEGEVDWRAAFYADPGVMRCPGCRIYLWREGTKVQCPECDHVWFPGAKAEQAKTAGEQP